MFSVIRAVVGERRLSDGSHRWCGWVLIDKCAPNHGLAVMNSSCITKSSCRPGLLIVLIMGDGPPRISDVSVACSIIIQKVCGHDATDIQRAKSGLILVFVRWRLGKVWVGPEQFFNGDGAGAVVIYIDPGSTSRNPSSSSKSGQDETRCFTRSADQHRNMKDKARVMEIANVRRNSCLGF